MKSFLKIAIVSILMLSVSTAMSQVGVPWKVKTTNGKLVSYGQTGTARTVDATATIVDTVKITNNSAGVIEVTAVGTDSLGNGITGKLIYRYKKVAGTITLATGTAVSAIVTDTGVSAATWAFAATASNNLKLTITGKAAWTVNWRWLIVHTHP